MDSDSRSENLDESPSVFCVSRNFVLISFSGGFPRTKESLSQSQKLVFEPLLHGGRVLRAVTAMACEFANLSATTRISENAQAPIACDLVFDCAARSNRDSR